MCGFPSLPTSLLENGREDERKGMLGLVVVVCWWWWEWCGRGGGVVGGGEEAGGGGGGGMRGRGVTETLEESTFPVKR